LRGKKYKLSSYEDEQGNIGPCHVSLGDDRWTEFSFLIKKSFIFGLVYTLCIIGE
jgi:hypothetical protein